MAILGDSTAISMNVLNTVEAGTIKKRGGTSSQFLKADGSVSTHSGMDKVGTVTNVAASARNCAQLCRACRHAAGGRLSCPPPCAD